METTTNDTNENTAVSPPQEVAERARAQIATSLGVAADDSTACLALIDHYLGSVPTDRPELVELAASTMGPYFGELLVAHLGGAWDVKDAAAPFSWRVYFANGLSVCPAGMALGAILGGKEGPSFQQEADEELDAPLGLRPLVAQILRGLGEVPEEQYHTLTCRFETLEAILEGLEEKPGQPPADVEDVDEPNEKLPQA